MKARVKRHDKGRVEYEMRKLVEKKVSVAELFYDLIFVYAISRITTTVNYLNHDEQIPFELLGKFLMLFLVFWCIWTYQTVFSNRFFMNRLRDYIFIFIDMFLVIILSQAINPDFEKTFFTFVACTTLLFLSILVQYVLVLVETKDSDVRGLCQRLIVTLLCSITLAAVALLTDSGIHFWLYFISILFVAFFPMVFSKTLAAVPTNFEHLAERYSLFVILLFGESVIAVATTISYQHISMASVLFYLIMVLLFAFYMITYTTGMNHHMETSGLTMIHSHLFIFISLNLITVLLEMYIHEPIEPYFFLTLLFVGMLMFFVSTLVNLKVYQKSGIDFTFKSFLPVVGILVVTFIAMLFVIQHIATTMFLLVVMLLGCLSYLRFIGLTKISR